MMLHLDSSSIRTLPSLPLSVHLSLLLPLPVAAFLIVPTDTQRLPQLLTLLNLRFGQLMYLMALQMFGVRATALSRLLIRELLPQSVAAVVYFIRIDPAIPPLVHVPPCAWSRYEILCETYSSSSS